MGTYALVAVVALVGLIPFGLSTLVTSGTSMTVLKLLLLQGLLLAGDYFLTPWIAAVALDGTGVLNSIQSGVRFAWRYPWLLAPAFASQKILDYLVGLADLDTERTVALGPLVVARGVLASVC